MLRTIRRPTRVAPLELFSSPLATYRCGFASSGSKEPEKDGQTTGAPSGLYPPSQEVEDVSKQRDASESRPPPSSPSPIEINDVKEQLRKWTEKTRPTVDDARAQLRKWTMQNASTLRARMDDFSAAAQVTFHRLGGRLNEVTGYHEIESLKKLVSENEHKMHEIREQTRAAKSAYEDAVSRRSNSQREVNDLLQRKSSWTDADVSRFTQLVRQDHLVEQEEVRAKAVAESADDAVERQFNELMRAILARYHEEQVWSDKIRSASTYGSLAALGLNLAVFVLAIVLVEPWKRKRLVQSFEKRVVELNEENQRVVERGLNDLKLRQAAQEALLVEMHAAAAALARAELPIPAVTVTMREGEGSAEVDVVSVSPPIEFEQRAKAARDRQIMAVSAAVGAVGVGIAGFVLGSWCS